MKKSAIALCRSVVLICVFSAVIFVFYYAFLRFFGGGRLFYDGLIAILLAVVVISVSLTISSKLGLNAARFDRTREEICSALLAASFLVYAFHITLPTIIDRSISLFVLSRMDNSNGLTVEEMQHSFLNGYVSGHDAVCRRIDEQLGSGNIRRTGDRYVITPRAEWLLVFLRSLAETFGQDQYFITRTSGALSFHYRLRDGHCEILPPGPEGTSRTAH